MSYRSWLEDVTNYRELGRHCRLLSKRASTQAEVEREWERETELWIERLNAPVPVDPSIARYFVTGEHDSWLLGFTRDRKEARLSLHSIKGDCFIEAYATAHGLAVPDVIPRVDLIFSDVVLVRTVRHQQNGALRHARLEIDPRSPLNMRGSLRYDWFEREEGRYQWIAELTSASPGKDLSHSLFLLIDAGDVGVLDLVPKAIREHLGEEAAALWSEPGDPWEKIFALRRLTE